jgi:hypothetical protein
LLIFFLDDMIVDRDDSDFPSSPGMPATNMLDSNSDSSDPGPDHQTRKPTTGLVNEHPTMNGMFTHNRVNNNLLIHLQQDLATVRATF